MARVTLVQMVYNGMRFIPKSFPSMLGQTYKDIEVVAVINGNADGGREYIEQNFPQVRIIDPGKNLLFVGGHNLVFGQTDTEFFQLVNQDLFLEPDYVERMLEAFADPKVGAVNGKIFQYDFSADQGAGRASDKLDTTGVVVSRTGRARSRGQHEVDRGQYDEALDLMAVDGAAPMFRKSALEHVKYPRPDGRYEYFDEDFVMYWEDVDLSWRLVNAGWKCRFAPRARGFHGRTAGSSPGGYKKVGSFIKFHKALPAQIRRWNYKNHIFLFYKNTPKFYWKFFVREFFMLGFIMIFETATLKVLPEIRRQWPLMKKKRRFIQEHRKISTAELEKLFVS